MRTGNYNSKEVRTNNPDPILPFVAVNQLLITRRTNFSPALNSIIIIRKNAFLLCALHAEAEIRSFRARALANARAKTQSYEAQ